jgi:hypothetical protein
LQGYLKAAVAVQQGGPTAGRHGRVGRHHEVRDLGAVVGNREVLVHGEARIVEDGWFPLEHLGWAGADGADGQRGRSEETVDVEKVLVVGV